MKSIKFIKEKNMKDYSVFLDESGNTGTNFLDFRQPLFTFVGIGLENRLLDTIIEEIIRIKTKYGYAKNDRLHAKRLFKKNKQTMIKELIELLMTNHFDLFIAIAEKRFAIATLIDSDLYDPAYNDNCDNSWTYPFGKNERANFLYDNLSDQSFIAFGNAYHLGKCLKEAFEFIKRDIKGKKYEIDLYEILKGAEGHLWELTEMYSSKSFDEKLGLSFGVVRTPNFFCYTDLLNKIENYYRLINVDNVQLIFDSSREFNVTFKAIVDILIRAKKYELVFPERLPLIYGYDKIKSLICQSSKVNPLLQLVDLLASSINNVMLKIYSDTGQNVYSEFESFIFYLFFTHKIEFGDTFSTFVISNKLLNKMVITLKQIEGHVVSKKI